MVAGVPSAGRKWKAAWLVGLAALWEGIAASGRVDPLLMPRLWDILKTAGEGLLSGTLGLQLLQSLGMVLLGLVAASAATAAMAFLDYFYRPFRALFDVLSSLLHPLPGIALLPVVILWFGIGLQAVYMVILHAVLWSMFLTVRMGMATIEKELVEAARSSGANRLQLYGHVLLPCSSHAIATGLQIGWSRGWRALISAEMVFGAISSLGGIGWYMYERRAFMDSTGMFAGILVVMAAGIAIEGLLFHRLNPHPDDRR